MTVFEKSLTINISIIYIIIYIILISLLSQFQKTVICHNCHLSLPNRQHTHTKKIRTKGLKAVSKGEAK